MNPTDRSPTQQAGDLCDLLLKFEEQKKLLADDKRRLDEAIALAKFNLSRIMLEGDMTVFGTNRAIATLKVTDEANVDDWDELYEHIIATQDFDLLHRRISGPAVAERVLAGKRVPGVSMRPVTKLEVKPKPR